MQYQSSVVSNEAHVSTSDLLVESNIHGMKIHLSLEENVLTKSMTENVILEDISSLSN